MNKEFPPIFYGSSAKPKEVMGGAFAQNMLLKALTNGVTDPEELRRLAGYKKVADVYLTLDKLSLRKEFHSALARAGIDLDLIAVKLGELVNSKNDELKLKALSLLLKSIGLDKYEGEDDQKTPWEDVVLGETDDQKTLDTKMTEEGLYEVDKPEMPEDLREIKEAEYRESADFYESK